MTGSNRTGRRPDTHLTYRWWALAAFAAACFTITPAVPQATLLPNAVQQFFNANGMPLNGGSVYFYIPSTTTPKTVWADSGQTMPYSQPVLLDAAGEPSSAAGIYGSGTYRQQVFDSNNNLIWDAVTASTGTGGGGGGGTAGDGMPLGFIMPFAGNALPSGYDWAAGQAYNRTTFALLMTALTITESATCTNMNQTITGLSATYQMGVGQPIESLAFPPGTTVASIVSASSITVSNAVTAASGPCTVTVFPWGNGNGSTTFNLPNYSGYALAGADNLNNAIANVLTSTTRTGGWDFLGAAGGSQVYTLTQSNLPAITPSITITDPGHTHNVTGGIEGGSSFTTLQSGASIGAPAPEAPIVIATAKTGITAALTSALGSGVAMPLVQPTVTVNYIIKVNANTGSFTIPIANNTVLGNNSGVSNPPTAVTAPAVIDMICSTRGAILERPATDWSCLNPGPSGYFLMSQGPGADPVYSALGIAPSTLSLAHNQVYVGNASNVAAAVALSGDCTIVASGAITCLSLNGNVLGTSGNTIPTNNSGFTQSGTANFTGAFEISSTAQTFPSSGVLAGTTDAQILTNKTIAYASNTLTGVAPLASPTFTGTVTAPAVTFSGITGSTQCLQVNTSGQVAGSGGTCGNTISLLNTLTAIGSTTVTISIASPAVITVSNSFIAGQAIQFATTGALPTGLSTATTYYVIAAGLSSSSFEVSTAFGGSAVNTTGTQSGTQTIQQANLIDNSSLTSAYTSYEVVLLNMNPVTASTGCELQVISAGALEASSYLGQFVQATGTGAAGVASTTFIACSYVAGGSGMTTTANLGATLNVSTPSGTAGPKQWWGTFAHQLTGPASLVATTGGVWNNSAAITGIAISPSSGVWAAGSIVKIYGKI